MHHFQMLLLLFGNCCCMDIQGENEVYCLHSKIILKFSAVHSCPNYLRGGRCCGSGMEPGTSRPVWGMGQHLWLCQFLQFAHWRDYSFIAASCIWETCNHLHCVLQPSQVCASHFYLPNFYSAHYFI